MRFAHRRPAYFCPASMQTRNFWKRPQSIHKFLGKNLNNRRLAFGEIQDVFHKKSFAPANFLILCTYGLKTSKRLKVTFFLRFPATNKSPQRTSMFSGSTCKASLHYSSLAHVKPSPSPNIPVWKFEKATSAQGKFESRPKMVSPQRE